MPDDDRFPRYLTPAWRQVLRGLQRRDPADRVEDAVTRALAATVREVHGVPSLPGLAEEMREAAASGSPLRQTLRPDVRHVPTEIAEQIATGLAVTMQQELALVSPFEAAKLLARKVLAGLAYHYGLDRMAQSLLRGGYTASELRAIMAGALSGNQVTKLADRFVVRPAGDGLRAPARRGLRRTLPELLTIDLEAL